MRVLKNIVLVLVAALFALWLVLNFKMVAGDENGKIRLVLGGLFSLLILFRRNAGSAGRAELPGWLVPSVAVAGALLVVAGLVLGIRQFEWLGFIMVLFSCLQWALPREYSSNIVLSLFLFYWIHPLPGQIFSRFQFMMQMISVHGAEWLLHCLNVHVWADGVILYKGFQTFMVPESCSGMITAVTVLLCVLGTGILLRLKWFDVVLLLGAGLVQVLALNVVRISFMVLWSSRMPSAWANAFLHDTLGILLLIAILLVQVEIHLWRAWKAKRALRAQLAAKHELELPDAGTMLPRFWQYVVRFGWRVVFVVLLAGGLVFALYKKRPAHRALMISEVVDGLSERDLAAAERAINIAVGFNPGDRELKCKRIQILVLRGKYGEALAELEGIQEPLATQEIIMKSWSLMGLDRLEKASALIESLPDKERRLPAVSMLKAECAMRQDKPAVVASNVVLAANSYMTVSRIRGLYPYLAIHEQWKAIADSDRQNVAYKDSLHALAAIYANLKLNNFFRASNILKAALVQWPNDRSFIGSLFVIASRRPGSEWEEMFAQNVSANIDKLDAERLASYMQYCFTLSRPDLAWQLYLKLRAMDPNDPALNLVPAQFGDAWFQIRRHQVGIEADNSSLRIDLKPLCKLFGDFEPFRSLLKAIPLAEKLSSSTVDKARAEFLNAALVELEKRRAAGKLSRREHMEYANVLMITGRHSEAYSMLDDLQKRYPEAKNEIIHQRAVFSAQQGRWQDSYECLVALRSSSGAANLNADLMLINAMMNMNMGVAAMEVAEHLRETFPDSPQVLMAIAGIWDTFGFKDQALFVIGSGGTQEWGARVSAQLLYDMGCFHEAGKICNATGITVVKRRIQERQGLFPIPAEWSVDRGLFPPISVAEMDREAERLGKASESATSPYFRRLWKLMLEWHRMHGRGHVSDPEAWMAAGRDNIEKAGAIHQLTVLLARQKEYAKAAQCAEEGLKLLPGSAALWRSLVCLTGGEKEVLARAYKVCPSDPEIWLANLVVRFKNEGEGRWAVEEMERTVAERRIAVGTMVRAGDYLFRNQMFEAAGLAAKDAVQRARGYLPAYVLGLRCALATKDMHLALACALKAAENSVDPAPFYATVVDIKSMGSAVDADTVSMLEYLNEHFPKNTQWAEQLGSIYFQKGDIKRSATVFASVLGGNLKNVKVRSILVAAESARIGGEADKAIGILESAYAMYPESSAVLNNLVYNLASTGSSNNLARARELLPRLIDSGDQSAVTLDTAAKVALKSGKVADAARYIKQALRLLDNSDYSAAEINLNAAEIMFNMGDYKDAMHLLETVERIRQKSGPVEAGMKDLMLKINDLSDSSPQK